MNTTEALPAQGSCQPHRHTHTHTHARAAGREPAQSCPRTGCQPHVPEVPTLQRPDQEQSRPCHTHVAQPTLPTLPNYSLPQAPKPHEDKPPQGKGCRGHPPCVLEPRLGVVSRAASGCLLSRGLSYLHLWRHVSTTFGCPSIPIRQISQGQMNRQSWPPRTCSVAFHHTRPLGRCSTV